MFIHRRIIFREWVYSGSAQFQWLNIYVARLTTMKYVRIRNSFRSAMAPALFANNIYGIGRIETLVFLYRIHVYIV